MWRYSVCLDKEQPEPACEGDHSLFCASILLRKEKKKYAFFAVYHTNFEDKLSFIEDFIVIFQHSTYKEVTFRVSGSLKCVVTS